MTEVHENSIGVLQILCMKGSPVLTQYDSGANHHLIEGSLAEELKIKVSNQKTCSIGIISGGKISTQYGSYQMFLGPTDNGKYNEIVAQGIQKITRTTPTFSLLEVNKEAIEYSNIASDSVLPPYVGGRRVELLIGLKNSDLLPVCIMSLPSGVGLYRSKFKDIFGSVYCYGGPHKSFTTNGKHFCGNFNQLTAYFSEIINQYKYSPYPINALSQENESINTNYNHLDVIKIDSTSLLCQNLKKNVLCIESEKDVSQAFSSFLLAGKGSQALVDIIINIKKKVSKLKNKLKEIDFLL